MKDHHTLSIRSDILIPIHPDIVIPVYRLNISEAKIINKTPLSETEIIDALSTLPYDMAEKYLRFKLINLNYKKLREIVKAKNTSAVKDEAYDRLEYNGLVAKGTRITYLGQPIYLGFQQRQVLRVFLDRPEQLISPDIFINNPDIFNPNKN